MKKQSTVSLLMVFMIGATSVQSWAVESGQKHLAGGTEGHGGDMGCDAKIQSVAANLRDWIKQNGPAVGPLDLSSSQNPNTGNSYTYHQYDRAMLSLLRGYIATPLSQCVTGPVLVQGVQKTCSSQIVGQGISITCDLGRFNALTDDQKVQQIHHEFATNVAGLEADDGGLSTYKISMQLGGGMADVVERKLVAKPFGTGAIATMQFVSIPLNNYCGDGIPTGSGCFWMGSSSSESGRFDNEKQNEVVLTKTFEMETTPVTQKQWFDVMGNNPSNFCSKEACPDTHQLVQGSNGQLTSLCPNNPVEQVSFEDAKSFVDKLNTKQDGHSYRQPTEAEWEYAARAGTSTAYYFGDDASKLGDHAWHTDNSGQHTHEVAQKGANAFGLYDVEGNVWEWVSDWYADDYGQSSGCNVSEDPQGPSSGSTRVIRGGSWSSNATYLRSANRNGRDPSGRSGNLGFRLVRQSQP